MYMRRMSYRRGAEGSFARLPDSQLWMNLEVLPDFCIPRFTVHSTLETLSFDLLLPIVDTILVRNGD